MKEIDHKFEIFYEQVSSMAFDQSNFNKKIQNDQNKLQEPLEVEIGKIRQESNLMMRELERTQHANRELMNNMIITADSERSPRKFKSFAQPSTAMTSTRARQKHNLSLNNEYIKSSVNKIRYSTPSVTAVPTSRLKRFKLEQPGKKDSVPDFSYLIRSKLKNKNNANRKINRVSGQLQ